MALRRFLPSTDFAYLWNEAGGERHLCITRRVRDKLVENRMLKPEECIPIVVMDEPPCGAEILDGRVEIPPPLLHENALAAAKIEADQAYELHLRHPKPARCIVLEVALNRLREVKEREPRLFQPGATDAELDAALSALSPTVPVAWRKVLKTANGFLFSLGDGFEVTATDRLPAEHNELQLSACARQKDFPTSLLHVTTGSSGDWHALDLARLTEQGDCPVLQYDHETLRYEYEWSCVGTFLEELLLKTFTGQDPLPS
jgi:hypothetical protein